ncbi:MAG TPA: hypothetical protein VK207_09700 [Bacteroidales bacterium]|nr:hypothetical protein [Bacteroidales bacterium]
MDLTGPIISAENQFKQILEEFFISIFKEDQLPSHGLSHHRRVWNTAKELTLILAEKNLIADARYIPGLIIASYIHDLGMAVDHGSRHGRHSMELCKRFLAENNLNEADFPGLLDAVLEHDNKEYTTPTGINLHTILSVSDDLDAFGYTGIYRYVEIYVLRGISSKDLGLRIRENAAKRYLHFEELFGGEKEILEKHRKRYTLLDEFFMNYEEQLKTGVKDELRVVEILTEMIENHIDPATTINLHKISDNPVVMKFFSALDEELTGRV